GSGGAISPAGSTSVAYGDSLLYTFTPDTGRHVANVIVDSTSVGAVASYKFTGVSRDHTIHVDFAVDIHTITASAGAGGTIAPVGAVNVAYGDAAAFAIMPNSGYHIADLLVDGRSVGAVSSYEFKNVVADHTIHATFALDTYNIAATAGAGGSISPAGNVTVTHGANQTFTIAADSSYAVADVLVDGVSAGAVTSYTFTN